MEANGIKATITVLITAFLMYFQNLMTPFIILFILMILDWITGLTNAWMHKELSSARGIQGIVKKVSYFVVIAVAMVADYLIFHVANQIGIEMPQALTAIGMLVTVWLIVNECISILENLAKIGTPMPAFLKKLMERLKEKTEDQGGNNGI